MLDNENYNNLYDDISESLELDEKDITDNLENIENDFNEDNNEYVSEKIFFIYTRVSKTWEYDMSLEDQKKVLIDLANKNWHKYIIIEEKWSGKETNIRKEFDKMMKILLEDSKLKKENRKYWWIYVFKLDRFARNSIDFTRGEALLNKNYRLVSATETIENTPTGRLLFRMLSSFAIFESEKLSNRQKLSTIQNLMRRNLRWLWWRINIFWYQFISDSKWKNKRSDDYELVIKPKESALVNRIYDLYIKYSSKENPINYISTEDKRYKKIWEILNNKERLLIKIKNTGENLKKAENLVIPWSEDLKLIERILKNVWSVKYNWNYYHSLHIWDELVINYINSIKKSDLEDVNLDWLNEVDSTITFWFYFNKLRIVPLSKYKLVQKLIKKNKSTSKKDSDKKKEIIWKYSWVIIYKNDEWKKIPIETYLWKTWTIQYRLKNRSTWSKDKMNKSQRILDDIFLKNKEIKNLKFDDKQIDFLRKKWLEYAKSFLDKRKRSLNANKMVYERVIRDYDYMLENSDYKFNEIQDLNEQKRVQMELLEKVNAQMMNIELIKTDLVEAFLGIFKEVKNILKDGDDEKINARLKVIFDVIYINSNWEIKQIVLSNFIKEILWMKESNM